MRVSQLQAREKLQTMLALLVLGFRSFAYRPTPTALAIKFLYHPTIWGPANIQRAAAAAMYGPYGKREDSPRFLSTTKVTPTTEPINELITNEKITACQPRNAPIAPINFTSPKPIASRGSTISELTASRQGTVSGFKVSSSIRKASGLSRITTFL